MIQLIEHVGHVATDREFGDKRLKNICQVTPLLDGSMQPEGACNDHTNRGF
jgi:hypothetical protein